MAAPAATVPTPMLCALMCIAIKVSCYLIVQLCGTHLMCSIYTSFCMLYTNILLVHVFGCWLKYCSDRNTTWWQWRLIATTCGYYKWKIPYLCHS